VLRLKIEEFITKKVVGPAMSIHMNPIKQLVTARRSKRMKLIPMLFYILDRLNILDSKLITDELNEVYDIFLLANGALH